MKRLLSLLLIIVMILSLASCGFLSGESGGTGTTATPSSTGSTTTRPTTTTPTTTKPTTTKPTASTTVNPDPDDSKLYNSFTAAEKDLFKEYLGVVIPFIPNDEYYVEQYATSDNNGTEVGINFYAWDNTKEEFNAYKDEIDALYEFDCALEDEYGDTWYFYVISDGVYLDIAYYLTDDGYVVDVYAYTYNESGSGSGGGSDSGSVDGDHIYTEFTDEEADLFRQYADTSIPFIANDEYYVEEYTLDYGDGTGEYGVNFYTYGNTQSEFDYYKSVMDFFYDYDYSEVDEYGDTWYYYIVDYDVYLDITYYCYDGECVVDVYVYYIDEMEGTDSGSGSVDTDDDLITNAGAGLPTGVNGVFDVDFRKADKVKDVTDQGNFLDGCPTTGSPAVLVIPVEFKDVTAASKGYTTSALAQAFGKDGDVDYYSVYDYYYVSSYNQLTLDITVLDDWFCPQYDSSYYYNATYDYYGDQVAIGDQLIMDEALAYLEDKMDLSQFDSDGNDVIDAIVLINTLDIGDEDFYWAYRYWNIYADDQGYYYEYDGVSANDYIWVSYQFLNEGYDENGEVYYDSSIMNTYTYIHEFGHVLGLDDYYDTSYSENELLLGGADMMDAMLGDHNAYSKFNLGWITASKLVVTDTSVTLQLEDFSKNGDTIILANNWDEKLGAYQEYYIIVYYTENGLHEGENAGYFAREGIVVYHVNASLYSEEYDGEIYYDIYNNNTDASDQYGTEDNLIEYVKSANDTFTYVEGDTLPTVIDDNAVALGYTFTIDALTGEYATITFTVK